jgi:nucleoside-diphosphate-sugar epimerase
MGRQRRDFTYIDDAAAYLRSVLTDHPLLRARAAQGQA